MNVAFSAAAVNRRGAARRTALSWPNSLGRAGRTKRRGMARPMFFRYFMTSPDIIRPSAGEAPAWLCDAGHKTISVARWFQDSATGNPRFGEMREMWPTAAPG